MSDHRVCILDYGSGNVRSVFNLVSVLAKDVRVSNDALVIRDATHLILPGVGAFGASMKKIQGRIPVDVLGAEVLEKNKPFLGICVGMQVLADKGYEFGENQGLGWIKGEVNMLVSGKYPLPHIGWNDIRPIKKSPLFEGFENILDFYFVHSFAFRSASRDVVVAEAVYGETFTCAIGVDNIFGVQFHPEKSQKAGRRLMKNFLEKVS